MLDDEKKPEAPKEEEPKQPDPKESSTLIVDTTDQHPEGFGIIMFLDGGEWPEGEEELAAGNDKKRR